MVTDAIKLFSTVKSSLLKATLFRGSLAGVLGIVLLICATAYLPAAKLTIWGGPILLVGGGLMVYGLIPYRRLTKMEEQPSELYLADDDYMQLIAGGKQQYTIPMDMIQKTEYIDRGNDYGIAIWFVPNAANKMIIHNHRLNVARYLKKSRQRYACDLFIPYFGRRSYTRLALFRDVEK